MTDPVLWIDPLHDLSVRFAAASWGKDLPETWGIISRAIQSEDLRNPVPVTEFLAFTQSLTPAPLPEAAPKVEEVEPTSGPEGLLLEDYKKNKTDLAVRELKRTRISRISIAGIATIALLCICLLSYGWIKDIILFPLLYASAPPPPTATNTPLLLRPNPTQPKKTPTPNTSIRLAFPECFHWSEITPAMQGEQVCVFGIITSFYPTTETSMRINFTEKPNSFFVYDLKFIYPDLEPGWCILIEGKVELTKNIPFISITQGLQGGFPPNPSDCQ